eukprot:12464195-Heterocapsa_arctica.AAC.1
MSQIDIALRWIATFLGNVVGSMRRVFRLDTICVADPNVTMTLDASPWGAGGFLTVDNVITA